MSTLFSEPLFYIYFIYGVSFLVMAGLIYRGIANATSMALVSSFSMLAVFGITHGTAELVDWVRFIRKTLGHPESIALVYASQLFLIVSFIVLLQFVINLLTYKNSRGKWLRAIPSLLAVVYLAAVFSLGISNILQAGLVARYTFGFAGSALSAVMFFRLNGAMRPLGNKKLGQGLTLAGASLAVYALVGGLIISPLFGLPIQMYRAVCAFLIAISASSILEIFKVDQG